MIKLDLNGKAWSLDAAPEMPLHYAIRDIAVLTSILFHDFNKVPLRLVLLSCFDLHKLLTVN
jgi:hypothetical protein